MSSRGLPKATYTGDGYNTTLETEGNTVRADGGRAARQAKFTALWTGLGYTSASQFNKRLKDNRCEQADLDIYLNALVKSDEDPGDSLDVLIEQLNTTKMGGGGMRQVGGSLVGLLALHIKIFKKPAGEVAMLSVGASLLLLQNTIILLDSLPNCFMYFAGDFLKHVLDWMMNLCKELYDNREDIATGFISGAKTAASAAGTAVVATPGAILYILRGVDALGMRFAEEYNPELNGFNEILDAVKRRNEEHHAMMDQLAAEQAEVAGKETDRTMELQKKKFVAQKKVDSMTAIREASEAAGRLHEQLTEEIAGLDHQLVMGEVRKGKGKGKGKGRGGKHATRKRGKHSSKRAPRKTKTTRKKRRGKK